MDCIGNFAVKSAWENGNETKLTNASMDCFQHSPAQVNRLLYRVGEEAEKHSSTL